MYKISKLRIYWSCRPCLNHSPISRLSFVQPSEWRRSGSGTPFLFLRHWIDYIFILHSTDQQQPNTSLTSTVFYVLCPLCLYECNKQCKKMKIYLSLCVQLTKNLLFRVAWFQMSLEIVVLYLLGSQLPRKIPIRHHQFFLTKQFVFSGTNIMIIIECYRERTKRTNQYRNTVEWK